MYSGVCAPCTPVTVSWNPRSLVPVYLLWVLILRIFILFFQKEHHLSNICSIFFLPAYYLRLYCSNQSVSNALQPHSCLFWASALSSLWAEGVFPWTEFYTSLHVLWLDVLILCSFMNVEFLLLDSVKGGSKLVFTDSCNLICRPSLPFELFILISVHRLGAFLLSSVHCPGAHLELLEVGTSWLFQQEGLVLENH